MRFVPVFAAAVAAFALAIAVTDASARSDAVALASGPLETAVIDPSAFTATDSAAAFRRVADAGGSHVRLVLYWAAVAPAGPDRPAGFAAADPADPLYRWESFDRQVGLASAAGLAPIVGIQLAPAWAERGTVGDAGTRRPDPDELALFARAAAIRYSGTFAGLPRVRYWQVWNEPNLDWFLMPQLEGATPVSAAWYRTMVNSFAAAVKAVQPTNLVVAGGTSPFGALGRAVAPLAFMRELLCMSRGPRPSETCTAQVRFDIWAHHPYSLGGPFRQAADPDNVSLGDLPEMERLLAAAVGAGRVVHSVPVRFWVTEFSWDTSPPDPKGVPVRLHARWVSEAMYQMWRSKVSLVTWFRLTDDPLTISSFQSGLHYYDGTANGVSKPKPAFAAFRFPFVAYREGKKVFVWGRTPAPSRTSVAVEQRVRGQWRPIRVVGTTAAGIFQARLTPFSAGDLRARLVAENGTSLAFSLRRPADLLLENPFGT